jgi:hypothetical protein
MTGRQQSPVMSCEQANPQGIFGLSVAASLITRQLASYLPQNHVAAGLRELGRLKRARFAFD